MSRIPRTIRLFQILPSNRENLFLTNFFLILCRWQRIYRIVQPFRSCLAGIRLIGRGQESRWNIEYPLPVILCYCNNRVGWLCVVDEESGGRYRFYTIQSSSSLFEVPKLPILANTSSTLVLFRSKDGTVIDEVSYTSKWHASSIKDQKGVSLERIDPDAETQSPSNWTSASATVGYGTPGYPNSQSDVSLPDDPDTPDEPTGIKTPQWDESAGHYTISYYLDQPDITAVLFVFNIVGQRVAQIANHELLGLTEKLTLGSVMPCREATTDWCLYLLC